MQYTNCIPLLLAATDVDLEIKKIIPIFVS